MTLAEAARGRDNNFHLIRFLAALAVLYGHCYPLAGGGAPPLADWLGIDIGSVAVDVFFVTSGFLVTASLRDRPGVRAFVWARVLRIYPALWGVVVLTVAVLGPLLTTRPAAAYWADPGVVDYLIKCASLWGGIAIHLPGVFEANPYPAAVNGSLWTLPYELRMYAILALLGIVVQRLGRRRQGVLTGAVALIAGVAGGTMLVRHFFHTDAGYFARFAWMFFCGACLQMAAARVPLGWSGLLAGGGVLALASLQRDVFFVAYVLLLGYLVVALAHVPGGVIRRFNRVGDCSYGVYLYAFPVQQTVVALLPGITPVGLLAVSAPLTVALAGLSWICVERRALAFKGRMDVERGMATEGSMR
ncbi:MAG TPA: acyltransferase [Zoogloea sp.]|uniref:acyltransferase family protein n=1 Tax=Zoogloea sp. TaxID=49181 RepID=UPI002CD878E9|nr:acyltransferase [Zoogloea sp.]HMV18368.1 acyltransferase [Rhodocyclaceae bacterium]HMV62442.1 acyltransferase [Rhodocyclaceae bacterium]HMW52667.1 acyltransferase [Rhodocyclaceae bacterium]HMY50547.1 acyltransferase [Rhodocyclaceae bacterium]HNA68830.1 acyltransferase [Rhodocyclaceae bacterium]